MWSGDFVQVPSEEYERDHAEELPGEFVIETNPLLSVSEFDARASASPSPELREDEYQDTFDEGDGKSNRSTPLLLLS